MLNVNFLGIHPDLPHLGAHPKLFPEVVGILQLRTGVAMGHVRQTSICHYTSGLHAQREQKKHSPYRHIPFAAIL